MSRITINELGLIDIEWFAIDRQGNVAAFWSTGDAYVPKFVFENKERNDKLAELFDLLPIGYRGKGVVFPVEETLARGLFLYDAEHEVNKFSENYELAGTPGKPIKYDELSDEIKGLMGLSELTYADNTNRQGCYFGDIEDFRTTKQIRVPNEFAYTEEELSILPEYIRQYTGDFTRYKSTTRTYLRCTCHNDKFDIYQDELTEEQKVIKTNYEKECAKELSGWGSIDSITDKEGKLHWYKRKLFFLKKEVFLPEPPYFLRLNLFVAKCCKCGNDIIVYDSHIYGPNALEENDDGELKNYAPKLKRVAKNVRVSVVYEIDDDSSPEDFSEITIAAISDAGYKKIFEMEM
jgi:hypothetical protein